MSNVKQRVEILKEWLGSERTKNLFKSISVYTTNYKPNLPKQAR